MRKYLLLLFSLVVCGGVSAQGVLYQLSPPAPNARVLICPSPDNGYPCPVQQNIYNDAGLTQLIAQPVNLGSSGFFSFYVTAGTYVIQLTGPGYNSSNRQVVNIGGSSGSGGGGIGGNTITVNSAPYNILPGSQIYDAAIASGSPNVTSTAFTFTSSMIGWLAHYTNCNAGIAPCIGTIYEFPLNGGVENTIIGCSPSCPSHVAILSTNASNTIAAGQGMFTFGPNNETGWTALEAALANLSTTPNCPQVIFGGGFYMTKNAHFNANTCTTPTFGSIDKQLTVASLGPYSSYIEPTQDFNFASCTGGVNSNTCFGGAQAMHFANIGLDGGGASLTGGSHSVNIFESRNDSYHTALYCINWGSSDTAMVGIVTNSGNQPSTGMQFSGCAHLPIEIKTGATSIYYSFFGGTTGTVLQVDAGTALGSYGSTYGYLLNQPACPTNVIQILVNGLYVGTGDGTGNCGAVNNVGIQVSGTGNFLGYQYTANIGGTAASADIQLSAAGGGGIAKCTACSLSTTGSAVANFAGANKFLSGGLNSFTGTANAVATGTTATTIMSPSDTTSGNVTPPTCTFTTGGGTTPSCAIQAGSTAERGVIIASTGTGSPGSTGTITLTFNYTYTLNGGAPVCTVSLDNSGTVWGNEAVLQVNTQSTTAPTFEWTNVNAVTQTALTVSSPYRIAYQCVAR